MQEAYRSGVHYLETATALLRRVRIAHPAAGLLEAADLHWWWRTPRSTDNLDQLFWFDQQSRPEAAVIATDWGDAIALDPVVMPDATGDWVGHVIERGLAHANQCGFDTVDVVIDRADDLARKVLADHGFALDGNAMGSSSTGLSVISAWLAADARPLTSPLHKGYRLCSRLDTMLQPHHMAQRSGPDVGARLGQTSLYRPDLDLVVLDGHNAVAAYSLFWFDPETRTGLVEPMRTEEGHQRRGLARHLLTTGLDLLARAGAERIKICFSPNNKAARSLYLSVGFEPDKQTVVLSRQVKARVP